MIKQSYLQKVLRVLTINVERMRFYSHFSEAVFQRYGTSLQAVFAIFMSLKQLIKLLSSGTKQHLSRPEAFHVALVCDKILLMGRKRHKRR